MKVILCYLTLLTFIIPSIFAGSTDKKVNINQATDTELQSLPSINSNRARAIVRSRKIKGAFLHPRQLVTRKIVTETEYNKIRNKITVGKTKKTREGKQSQISVKKLPSLKAELTLLENAQFYSALTQRIEKAKKEISLTTFLFKTSSNPYNSANRLLRKLVQARKRGVKVYVILEKSGFNKSINEENLSTLRRLHLGGISARFEGVEKQTHTKLAVIDKEWTFLGSHNISHSALSINNELSVMVRSKPFAKKALQHVARIR